MGLVEQFVESQNEHAERRSYVYNATNMVVNFSVYNGNDWMGNTSWFAGMAVAAGKKTMHPGDSLYIELGGLGRSGEGMKLYIDNSGPAFEVHEKSFYIWTGKKFADVTSSVVKSLD